MQNNKTADFYCLRKNDIISQLKTIKPVALSPYLANISVHIYQCREQVKRSQFSPKQKVTRKMRVQTKLSK
jgi:hypothetical protein